MGLKCLIVAVLFMSPCVFGRDCMKILDNKTSNICNECIRCGGKWCNDVSENRHCIGGQSDDNWCPEHQEKHSEPPTTSTPGLYFDPVYAEKRAFVYSTTLKTITFRRPSVMSGLKPYFKILNTTLSAVLDVEIETAVQGSSILVRTKIGPEFCSADSTTFEYVSVNVGLIGISEEVLLKYQVPCACGCTERVEKNSMKCSGYGDFSCGVCHCKEDRWGPRCENKKCSDRGDNPPSCNNPSNPEIQCSQNGRCNECNECECFTDINIEGSQYFDPDNYCEDICTATNRCSDCLKNNEVGHCDQCDTAYVYVVNASKSALEEREQGRKVWVHCNVTVECGLIQTAAMQRDGKKQVMILSGCEAYVGAVRGTGITVPVVSTLLIVAALTAAAGVGYWVWKGKGAAPLPLTSPEYTNIDAEDCTGVNPLYKPPTSSFKNPMYGKS